jgi:hypothetical protein
LAWSGPGAGGTTEADRGGTMPHQTNNRDMQECIERCQECADICLKTSTHCLKMGGEHAAPAHQVLLHDCAQVCATSAAFMSRMSHHHAVLCRACAEVCAACADDCERLAGGDRMMTQCADACRRCAQSCEHMASAGV